MFHLRYLPLFFLQQLINLFYILRDPVLFTKNLKVGLIPDQHDFLEFPIRMIFKTRNLFTGADAATEDRPLEGRVVGFRGGMFLFS